MKGAKKTATMTQVAELAGVSQTTVSLVLNGKNVDNIPLETQEKVLEASKKLGYRVNRLAGALNGAGSGMIGLLADELITTNFASDIVQGAQDMAWENDKTVMIASLNGDEKRREQAINMLLGYRVDAVIYATTYYKKIAFPPQLTHIPTILVNCYDAEKKYPCIVPDDFQGAYDAAECLIRNGHRDIIYFSNSLCVEGTDEKIPATILREEGFKKALMDYGIEVREHSIQPLEITGENIFERVCAVLKSEHRPTAIMCYNDRMAVSVYSAIKSLNLKIPEDISVIGYDNQSVIVDFLNPRLTTVELPHYQMGRAAIQYFLKNKADSKFTKLPPKLIVGKSIKNIGSEG